MLSAVTLDELAGLVRSAIEAGKASEKQEGRQQLLAVVEALGAAQQPDGDDLLTGRCWRVASVRVGGLGGIAALDPPSLALPPVSGVTVVRGQNGSGKTSLARAVECTLRGERDLPDEASGDLWTAALLTEGATSGTVEVTLASGDEQLTISAAFAAFGDPVISATLTGPGGRREVSLGDDWRATLLAARACYSYGSLQSRLSGHKELQGYLEELLVLGPAWARVRTEVIQRGDEATTSRKALNGALKEAKAAEAALTARFDRDGRAPTAPAPVAWPGPRAAQAVDDWLTSTGLAGVTSPPTTFQVRVDHERRVAELGAALSKAEDELAAADNALTTPGMAAALDHVERLLRNPDLPASACPLCGSSVDWREHASTVTATVRERGDAVRAVETAVRGLADWASGHLAPLVATGTPGGPDATLAAFQDALSAGGCRPHSPAHRAARPLLDAVTGPEHAAWLERLRSTSDATREWRAELSSVVVTFAAAWRENGERAAAAGAWGKAKETLDELQLELRQSRQDAVTLHLHEAITKLLPDAEIDLAGIRHAGGVHNRGGVDVRLTIGGHDATLGMLSSGQRNALLLAPLVILDGAAQFGFLVVDDPVHALDDLRVDRLARELVRLGEHLQVIVLTHDPRLEEHLRARCPDLGVVEIDRDPRNRTMTWSAHTTPWEALLKDARDLCSGALDDGWRHTESTESVVGGLCRAAVDGAIRQAAITRAVVRSEDVGEALDVLGTARKTGKRMEHMLGLAGGAARLPKLDECRRRHLRAWNRGVHGTPSTGVDLNAGIRAAQVACAELDAFPWR